MLTAAELQKSQSEASAIVTPTDVIPIRIVEFQQSWIDETGYPAGAVQWGKENLQPEEVVVGSYLTNRSLKKFRIEKPSLGMVRFRCELSNNRALYANEGEMRITTPDKATVFEVYRRFIDPLAYDDHPVMCRRVWRMIRKLIHKDYDIGDDIPVFRNNMLTLLAERINEVFDYRFSLYGQRDGWADQNIFRPGDNVVGQFAGRWPDPPPVTQAQVDTYQEVRHWLSQFDPCTEDRPHQEIYDMKPNEMFDHLVGMLFPAFNCDS